jgi:hypothetical protein
VSWWGDMGWARVETSPDFLPVARKPPLFSWSEMSSPPLSSASQFHATSTSGPYCMGPPILEFPLRPTAERSKHPTTRATPPSCHPQASARRVHNCSSTRTTCTSNGPIRLYLWDSTLPPGCLPYVSNTTTSRHYCRRRFQPAHYTAALQCPDSDPARRHYHPGTSQLCHLPPTIW